MCGICGFTAPDTGLLKKLIESLRHRGPDDAGFFTNNAVSLGHRRLAIIDLSPNGAQPMYNADKTVVSVFNGEIYNYRELKRDFLSESEFKSNADSEVIPHLYEKQGLEFINNLRGIFAIALYDKNRETLYLIRDRFGVKPLYYTRQNGVCYFSSELKTFRHIPDVAREIDFDRYLEYLGLQYVPGENTIFKNIYRVEPGSYLEIRKGKTKKIKYYCLPPPGDAPLESEKEYRDILEEKILESTKFRLISDVPIGVLLSGGLDSSSLVAFLSRLGVGEINTFSVGFGKPSDELQYAKLVAEQFNTNHTELMIDVDQIKQNLPAIVHSLDEPLADVGAFASWIVFKHVRENSDIKVALVGEGADEIFAGYSWHRLLGKAKGIPEFIRNRLFFLLTTFAGKSVKNKVFSEIYQPQLRRIDCPDYVNKLLRFEFQNNLVHNLLMKVDKSSMAFGIEAREVFLDHELVETAFACPGNLKMGKTSKYIFKTIMQGALPDEILQRKKQGFIMPINQWVHEDLKEDILFRLRDEGSYLRKIMSKSQIGKLFYHRKWTPLRNISHNAFLWRAYLFEIFKSQMQ